MKSFEIAWLGAVLAVASGCSGAADKQDNAAGGRSGKPLYAIESLVFGMTEADRSTSYVLLTSSLDDQPALELGGAREFAGYAPLDTIAGKLYVGGGESPDVTGFEVTDDSSWDELDTVSFGNFSSASLEGDVLVDEHRAFVALGDKSYVAWDPARMTVGSPLDLPSSVPRMRGALKVQRGYSHELIGHTVYQPYYWADESFQSYSKESQIAVLDAAAAKFTAIVDAPCPHLHISTKDEDDNLYFSNGAASIASAVLDEKQPRNCMVRIKKGADVIDSAFTVNFKDLTGGREGSNLFYIGNDVGFFNVYHAERDDKANPAYADLMYSANYHLWTLDMKTMTAKIMDGIGFTGGQYVAFHLGDRVFVAVPNASYTSTAVYEVLTSGSAAKRFDVKGWAFKMLKVR